MVALGEEALKRHIKTIGLFNTKAKNVIALSQALIDRLWRRGAARPRRARDAARRRPQDRQCRPQHRLRRGDFAVDTHIFRVCNRTGLAPGKTPLEVELKLEKVTAAAVPPRRAPLADPARPLHLQGAEARMLALPGDRPLPLQAEDAAAEGLSAKRRSNRRLGRQQFILRQAGRAGGVAADRSRSRPIAFAEVRRGVAADATRSIDTRPSTGRHIPPPKRACPACEKPRK